MKNPIFVLIILYSFAANASIKMSITVDDLPDHGKLPPGVSKLDVVKKFLAVLDEEKIPEAYGFINAGKIKNAEDLEVLKLWVQAGHPLANHTLNHIDLNKNAALDFTSEISANEVVLKDLNQKMDWKYFRYPYLHEGENMEKRNSVRKFLKNQGYRIAQVSVDFEDWAWNNPYARCMAKKDSKSIKWLEETYLENAYAKLDESQKMSPALLNRQIPHILLLHIGAFDAEILRHLIRGYKKRGVEFITLHEAMKDEIYETDPAIAAEHGSEILQQLRKSRKLEMKDLKLKKFTGYPGKELAKICL